MKRRFRECGEALMLFALAGLCGCVNPRPVHFPDRRPNEPVRAVIFQGIPENRDFAERARKIGNEAYPKILQLLGEKASEAPAHFDIVFQNHASVKTLMDDDSGGFTRNGTVYLGVDWLTNSPEELDGYLVHEMGHVAQNYDFRKVPAHWTEGLADYARFKLGYSNDWVCAKCSARFPHYTSGYGCAAAFLMFVEANHDNRIAIRLNDSLRHDAYSDELFKNATGKDLGQLWAEFQRTAAFTPAAAELLKVEESVGYVNGQPGKEAKPDAERKIAQARELAVIQEQPGGALVIEAFKFLESLKNENRLPGWGKDEKGNATVALNNTEIMRHPTYPFRYTVTATKESDGFTYHWAVVRESEKAGWKLEKSWCTDQNGRLVRDL
jgi:hypothetical protein